MVLADGHDGSISGFTTMALTNPAKNITLVAVGNTGSTGVTVKNGVEMLAMIDPDFLKPTGQIPGVPGQNAADAAKSSASASAVAGIQTPNIGAANNAAPTAAAPAGSAGRTQSYAIGAVSTIAALVASIAFL
jgi:hypothetical protein